MPKHESICIRKFESSDLDDVKSLIYRTIDVCYRPVYNEESVNFFKEWHCGEHILEDAKEGYTIVLEKGDVMVGTGTILADEIKRVFVGPVFQKNGLGRLIMRKLEEKAVSSGLSTVKLDASLPSKKFYDLLGYITLEQTSLEVDNGKRLDYFKMEKSLTGAT